MNLPEFSLKRPVTIIVAMIIITTIGIISLIKLPLEMFPDISFPGLMVQVPYPSSSPEEVERTITRPIEEILSTINNLKNIKSTSSSSSSRIHLEFENGTNMDYASMEIRDKIDQIRYKLPDDIEKIRIRRWSTSDFPVISFSISIPGGDLKNLYDTAENVIQPELERIEGVANVDIRGLSNKQLVITLNPSLFYTSSINILDLINTIRNNNINISAGYVEENKRFVLRVPGELKYAEQIKELPVNDKGLKIKDIAKITYTYPEKERFYKLNSHDALSFRIYRASNSNVVEVCKRVRSTMEKIQKKGKNLDNINILYFRDQSKDILNSLRDLSYAGIIGALLATFTLFFFLRKFRSTIIIAVAIPMSMVFTFGFMYIYRTLSSSSITINIISLSGLMMAVGMLVDNGVVVLENIFRLRQEKKYSPFEASIKGSSEVALAVTASTLTTLVVFISLSFISGSGFGRWMGDFALTISIALVASLIVSLTFIPLAGTKLLKGKTRKKAKWLVKLTSIYEKIISFTIKSRKSKAITISAAIGILISAFLMMSNVEREFSPMSEERTIRAQLVMPQSYSLREMNNLFNTYENKLKNKKKELAIENMTSYYGITNKRGGQYIGNITFYLSESGPSISETKKSLKELFPKKPGVTLEFGERMGRGGHSAGISVELIGMDFTQLTELVPIVKEKLKGINEIEDISTDLEGGETQLMVKVNREKAESSGVDSRQVARVLMSSISDRPIGKFKTENKEIDIILKMKSDEGFNQDDLKNISLRIASKRIPISAISTFSYRMGSMSIRKENKKSKLRIMVNSKSKGMMKITNKIQQVMNTIKFPEGYSWSFGSRWRRFRESQESSNLAIILALIFIYIIMASLFESFIHPLTILMTVPLALFGVALFFTIFDITLNNASYLGLLTLFGIVVNNGILLIDRILKLRKKGMEKNIAIVQAGKDRMRPIIMTAITTIFGVLPMALPVLLPQLFKASQGRAQMWAPISIAIIGGLTTSTFFTLIILPTLYSISDSVTTRFKKLLGFEHN